MNWNVADLMTRNVVTVDSSASFKTCVRLMRMHGVGALPVLARGEVVGIITVTDLMLKELRPSVRERYQRRSADGPVEQALDAATVMTRKPITIGPGAPIAAVVRLMFEHRINRLPVVDAEGGLVGIVSRSDILRVFLRSDLSIRNEVAGAVLGDLTVAGGGQITTVVRDGVVTLDGEVERGSLTDLLIRLVGSVPGVVAVHNHLRVTGRGTGAVHA